MMAGSVEGWPLWREAGMLLQRGWGGVSSAKQLKIKGSSKQEKQKKEKKQNQ